MFENNEMNDQEEKKNTEKIFETNNQFQRALMDIDPIGWTDRPDQADQRKEKKTHFKFIGITRVENYTLNYKETALIFLTEPYLYISEIRCGFVRLY